MDKITQILENVLRYKYFEACVHIKNPIKNSYQDGVGRTTHTLDHVVVVHILIWDKRNSQINEYSDVCFDLQILSSQFTFSSYGQFTISIELDKTKLLILNTILSIGFVTNPPKGDDSNTKSKRHETSKSHNPWFGARVRLFALITGMIFMNHYANTKCYMTCSLNSASSLQHWWRGW